MQSKTLPILYKIDAKGKTREYIIQYDESEYLTTAGIVGGNFIPTYHTVTAKGKNTLAEQVEKEAKAKWHKKYERELYKEDLSKPHPLAFIQPMLARDYTKVSHQIDWEKGEYVAQRKLNGVRCIAQYNDGEITLTSRKGKQYSVPNIDDELFEQIFQYNKNIILDGELYIHGVELGDVTHAIAHADNHLELEFHIFDIVNENIDFIARHEQIANFNLIQPLVCVGYEDIINEEEMIIKHDKFVKQGYEGVMIRDLYSLYESGKRSLGLFKRKVFQDDEFKIINVKQDKDGGAILVLKTIADIVFDSRPMGTNQHRLDLYQDRDTLIGKMATVKYSTLLATGIPEFNRTTRIDSIIRDYE